MNKANECTCPSGDGSLVHPCPAHPAVEQAGANVGHGHVFPRADGVKMRCGGPGLCSECTADASRARAALAQPSPASDLDPFNLAPHAEAFNEAPDEALRPEQAGGDERDFQAEGAQEVPSPVSQEYDRHLISLLRKGEALPGHQEEAADEIERLRDWNDHLNNTVLPNILNPNFLMLMKGGERLLDLCTKDGKFIGVSLNDMKDVFDWMVTHARIAPDHAALAQPSQAIAAAPTYQFQSREIGESDWAPCDFRWYLYCSKSPEMDTRVVEVAAQPSPAQAEQAEAERQEVVARVVHSNPVVLDQCAPLNANDEMMTVAQHAASVARWAEMFNRVEQQRDAALAEVERLRQFERPELDQLYSMLGAESQVDAAKKIAELIGCRMSRSALTEAQMRRIYENSTEAENERLGFAAFARLMRRAEAVHQIAAAPQPVAEGE
ncbi:hypothetical protein JTL83_06655 [Pseudomonas aeruginosa]|nr:hypothetical protein [Pseudomonas aeruginosa]